MKWPQIRSDHASAIINMASSNEDVISHFIILGGLDNDSQLINDCRVMNLSSLIWRQVFVHHITQVYNTQLS